MQRCVTNGWRDPLLLTALTLVKSTRRKRKRAGWQDLEKRQRRQRQGKTHEKLLLSTLRLNLDSSRVLLAINLWFGLDQTVADPSANNCMINEALLKQRNKVELYPPVIFLKISTAYNTVIFSVLPNHNPWHNRGKILCDCVMLSVWIGFICISNWNPYICRLQTETTKHQNMETDL